MASIPSFNDLETDNVSIFLSENFQGFREDLNLHTESGCDKRELLGPNPLGNVMETPAVDHVDLKSSRGPSDLLDEQFHDTFEIQNEGSDSSAYDTEMCVAKVKEKGETEMEYYGINAETEIPTHVQEEVPVIRTEEEHMTPFLEEFSTLSVVEANDHPEVDLDDDSAELYELLEDPDEDGDTLLHQAIIMLNTELAITIIRMMAQAGLDLDCKNLLHQTPLHLAVLTSETRIVKELVENGASLEIRDKLGRTPLHIACEMLRPDLVTLVMVFHVPGNLPRAGHTNNSKTKVETVLDIKNYNGEACMHIAAKSGNVALASCLIKHGASVNLPDEKSGRGALHFAAENNDVKMVEFLLSVKGVNPSAETFNSETPILLAYLRDFNDIVQLFRGSQNR